MKHIIFPVLTAAMAILSSSCANTGKIPEAKIPIMAWYSIPASDASPERYRELADCGFTINFSHLRTLDELMQSLDCAEQAGIKVMATCRELESDTDSVVNIIKNHPALYGYFLRDEPVTADFPRLAAWAEKIRAVDDSHPMYLNLFPNYVSPAALGCGYKVYVHRFIEEVKLPLVSFDFYPVTADGIRQSWYQNLQDIADESATAGLPFWAFALSTAHAPYPLPTMASLRLQMYTNLAYGASALQYFTYWNPGTQTWNFHEAPINQNKQKSEAYELVKAMNEELQARAGVFVGSKVVYLAHTGESVPPECRKLEEEMPAHVKLLRTSGPEGAVISLLENGGWNYLVAVSRTIDSPISLEVGFDEKAALIGRDGTVQKIKGTRTSFEIDEGDALIFRFRK